MREPDIRNDTSGVSPIISAILLFTIMLLTVGAIMAWAIPRIQGMEEDAQYDGAYSGLEVFDSRVDDVIYGGQGTTRTSYLSIGGGDILLARDDGYWLVYWSLIQENITFSGVDSDNGEFTFTFDRLSNNNLAINITGTKAGGEYTSNNGKVEPGFKFGDLQYIRISNSTKELAEAYYFKIRVLEYQLRTNHGYFEIKWLNGALVTNKGSSVGLVRDSPYIYSRGDSLFMNIINLSANHSGFLSGQSGSYSIDVRHLNSTLLTNKPVYSVRMSIHSEYPKAWNNFFLDNRGFTEVKDSRYRTIGLSYHPGEFTNLKLMRTSIELTGGTR